MKSRRDAKIVAGGEPRSGAAPVTANPGTNPKERQITIEKQRLLSPLQGWIGFVSYPGACAPG